MTNFQKGWLDGYRVLKYKKLPRFPCGVEDTQEYKTGYKTGQEMYIQKVRSGKE